MVSAPNAEGGSATAPACFFLKSICGLLGYPVAVARPQTHFAGLSFPLRPWPITPPPVVNCPAVPLRQASTGAPMGFCCSVIWRIPPPNQENQCSIPSPPRVRVGRRGVNLNYVFCCGLFLVFLDGRFFGISSFCSNAILIHEHLARPFLVAIISKAFGKFRPKRCMVWNQNVTCLHSMCNQIAFFEVVFALYLYEFSCYLPPDGLPSNV